MDTVSEDGRKVAMKEASLILSDDVQRWLNNVAKAAGAQ